MSNWLIIVAGGLKVGLGMLMLTQGIGGSDPLASLVGGSLCMARISWLIASRVVPDL
jgi:hypothetical protein